MRVPFQLSVFNILVGGSKIIGGFDISFRASCLVCSIQYYWCSLLLLLGFCINPLFSVVWFCGIILSWFPVQKGIQNSQRGCFSTACDFLGTILPAFFFHCSVTKKVSTGCLLFSPTGFLCVRLSCYSVEEERIK